MGPSPRVRGKRPRSHPPNGSLRSIPARAGETPRGYESRALPGVHPRACGGNAGYQIARTSRAGPSPRVRGKLPPSCQMVPLLRSIPARAGETGHGEPTTYARRVHPRACGGNSNRPTHPGTYSGPSPRVRGETRGTDDGPLRPRVHPVNGNRKPHICGNRKLHTPGEDVSGGADILPVMPVGRFGLDAGSGATGVLANTRREAAEPAVTLRLPHAVRPTLSSASADAPASGSCCPGC